MEFKFLSEAEKEYYREQIIALLLESDGDFLPPLSSRTSTKDSTFSSECANCSGVLSYYKAMNSQMILCATVDGSPVGFVSFYENYEGGEEPNIYVSTLVVAKSARGCGLTSKMYAYLFDEVYAECHIYTRTWSTNAAHTKILSRFGFSELKRIKDDRGEGIDTVYYVRRAKSLATV